MKEVTDEVIKKKHKEFNQEIQALLDELQRGASMGVNPVMQKLRQAASQRQLTAS